MRHFKNLAALVFVFYFFTASSCKKEGNNTGSTAPTNLTVNAVVSTDGTGNVSFTATATNAVSYDFEFGDGVVETVTTGITTHRYSLAGTNTFTVKVTAKSSSGATGLAKRHAARTANLPVRQRGGQSCQVPGFGED